MSKLYASFLSLVVLVFSSTVIGQTSDKETLSPAKKITTDPAKDTLERQETPQLSTSSKVNKENKVIESTEPAQLSTTGGKARLVKQSKKESPARLEQDSSKGAQKEKESLKP